MAGGVALGHDRDAFDRDLQVPRKRDHWRRPRGRIHRERLREQRIQLRKFGRIRQEDGRLHHVLEAASRRAQHGVEIRECLPRLRGEVCGRLAGQGIDARLAGSEEEVAHTDRV